MDGSSLSTPLQQLTEKDQELYQNFPLVISERWQSEVAETVFETINQEADKAESKKKTKHRKFDLDERGTATAPFLFFKSVCLLPPLFDGVTSRYFPVRNGQERPGVR